MEDDVAKCLYISATFMIICSISGEDNSNWFKNRMFIAVHVNIYVVILIRAYVPSLPNGSSVQCDVRVLCVFVLNMLFVTSNT